MDQERLQARPALIVSRPIGPAGSLVWTLMITSARRGRWPGDIAVGIDHARFGLPVPCFIRTAKIATLELAAIERRLGRLSSDLLDETRAALRTTLAER